MKHLPYIENFPGRVWKAVTTAGSATDVLRRSNKKVCVERLCQRKVLCRLWQRGWQGLSAAAAAVHICLRHLTLAKRMSPLSPFMVC